MTLRPATLADADLLFAWATDETTRRHSRNTGEINMPGHVMWLTTMLRYAAQVRMWIAEDGSTPVGIGRLNFNAHDVEVSLTVAPEWRGKGYARPLIRGVMAECPVRKPFVAQILNTNLPSLLAFLKEGFVATEMVDDYNIVIPRGHVLANPNGRAWLWLRRTPGLAELA